MFQTYIPKQKFDSKYFTWLFIGSRFFFSKFVNNFPEWLYGKRSLFLTYWIYWKYFMHVGLTSLESLARIYVISYNVSYETLTWICNEKKKETKIH